jgi:hypothetical protein
MPRDINELAHKLGRMATGQEPPEPKKPAKNPAAVALGKLGGKKGGKARAAKLSPRKRKEIARKAARAVGEIDPYPSSNNPAWRVFGG